MQIDWKNRSFVIDMTNRAATAVASYLALYFLMKLMSLPSNSLILCGLILLAAVIAYFAQNNKTVLKALIAATGSIVLLSAIGLYVPGAAGNILGIIPKAFIWFIDYFRNLGNYLESYALVLIIFLTFLVYSLLHVLICVVNRHLLAVLAAALPLLLYYAIYTRIALPLFYLLCLVILAGFLLNAFMVKYKRKGQEYASLRVFFAWFAAVMFIVFAIAFVLPSNKYPIQIKWLDKKINEYIEAHRKTSFSKLSIKEQFTDDKTYLGAPLKLDKIPVMTVTAPRKMYLRGNTSDVYTGNMWYNSDNSTKSYSDYSELNEEIQDLLTGPTLLNSFQKPINDYYVSEKISIKYSRIKTLTLFSQLKANTVEMASRKWLSRLRVGTDGTLIANRNMSTGYDYKITTFSINYNSTTLANLLRRSNAGIYSVQLDPNSTSFTSEDIKRLEERAKAIREKYLKLPQYYSEKVKNLTLSVTANSNNNYDKAKAIESYLSENFLYTESPETPDPERDFVEQFLFEIQKGYCTHYASAMVVMLRSIGIPARFVEGYVLPELPEQDKTTYKVTNKQAHAWVEAYFDGFGWVTFEPTAGFTKSFYETMGTNFRPLPNSTPKATATPQVTSTVDPSLSPKSSPTTTTLKPINELPFVELIPPFMRTPGFIKAVLTVLSILFAIGAALLALYLINKRRVAAFLKQISLAAPKQAVLKLSPKWFGLLERLELSRLPHETAQEYLINLMRHRELRKNGIEEFIKIFVEARYSANNIDVRDKNTAMNSYLSLLNYYILVKGKANFYFMRYIAGRI